MPVTDLGLTSMLLWLVKRRPRCPQPPEEASEHELRPSGLGRLWKPDESLRDGDGRPRGDDDTPLRGVADCGLKRHTTPHVSSGQVRSAQVRSGQYRTP